MAINLEDYTPALKYGATIDSADDINLPSAQILVGNASGVAANVAMSGDITISNTGATTIGAGKITGAKTTMLIQYEQIALATAGPTQVNVFGAATAPVSGTVTALVVANQLATAGTIVLWGTTAGTMTTFSFGTSTVVGSCWGTSIAAAVVAGDALYVKTTAGTGTAFISFQSPN